MYTGYQPLRQTNPRESCSILSYLTFAYTIELFKKGIKDNLHESDIYEVSKSCSSKRCGDKIENDWKCCKTVTRLLWKRFGTKYLIYSGILLAWTLTHSTIQPYSMSRFISYFEKNQTKISRNDAYFYGGTYISVWLFRCFWIHNYFMLECILGIQIKSALTSLIYRKVLKLRPEKIKGSSMGNMVTVLTKDIRTITTAMWAVCDSLISSIQFLYLSYLLYSRVGIVALIAVGILLLAIISQVILSQFIVKMRLKVGRLSDKRLHFTREALSSLKIIKMYTWETFFLNRICQARKEETKASLKAWYLGIAISCLSTLVAKMVFPVFLISYKSLGYSISTEMVYYVMTIFKELYFVVGIILPMGISLRSEIYAAILRVERILNIKELNDNECEELPNHEKNNHPKLDLQHVSVKIEGNEILRDISLNINENGLYIISGPLGAGKSSLIRAILGEYSVTNGHLDVEGTISYASQDPWLFPATVKQNILFGQEFNRLRYNKIVSLCSLEYDFKILPNGDNTVIADGGLNLSKGQQARVNLARAIYNDSDIYLLDDPLAGLDVRVQEEIFNDCIKSFLCNKIVLFVTQNPQQFEYAKNVITVDNGKIESIFELKDIPSKKLAHIGASELTADFNKEKVNDVNHTTLLKSDDLQGNIYHENKNIGKVDIENYISYIKYGGVFSFAFIIFVFICAQFTESYSDKLVSEWVDYQQGTLNLTVVHENATSSLNDTMALNHLIGLRDYTFHLYIVMIGVSSGIDLIKSYLFLAFCRRSSIKFHKTMCQSVINCVMPFLDNHFIGNILNRFSYDLDHIDEVFPFLFLELIKSTFAIAGTLFLIVTVKWMFLLTSMVFFFTLLGIRMFYIPAARAIKRLVAITRSPFIGHLNATVEGISTIKAFKAEELLKEEFDRHQDLAISTTFMETTLARAFGYATDFDCWLFVASVILTFLFLDTDTSVGNIGLALTQILALSGNLQWIIRCWAELEQCMTSVERVVEYTGIPQENDKQGKQLTNWSPKGKIIFDNVSLVYKFESKVLKNVIFTINPGEKIVIIGRTGAGKSSIVSTLFRLYDYQGKIWIDETDISSIPLQSLRKHISIIPQDPITFEGAVRDNVDPYQCYVDRDLWEALNKVKMNTIIKSLDTNIMDLSLSTGHKQLLSLARVLLQNNSIIVMDEPTANLDAETDILVRNLIKDHFSRCTVVTIAHRLKSALESDRVMVMEKGNILEFDDPKILLANKRSVFYQMINRIKTD